MLPKTLKTFLTVFPIFFTVILIATFGLLNGYFEQDEWLGIASVMKSYNLPWWDVFVPGQMHFSPLGTFFWSMLYKSFYLQAQYFFLTELIVHASVATLAFILTSRLTNSRSVAAITGILFLLNGRAYQAFTHLAIFHSTTITMFFILLFFVYLSSIKEKIFSIKKVVVLFLIFLAAVSIREEGFIIIPTFIAYLFCFDRLKINRKNIAAFSAFFTGVIVFLFVRFFAQKLYSEPIAVQYQITGSGAEYNLVTLPLKYVVQSLIYSERIAVFLLNNTQKIYPTVESYFISQAPMMDAAFFYIFGLIAVIFALWLWLIKPKRIGLFLIVIFIWIGANAFMLSFVGRSIFVLEPRYLYFSSFPVLLLVSIFIHSLFTSKNKIEIINFLRKVSAVILFVFLLGTSIQEIRTAVDYMNRSGEIKKRVLENLLKVHPSLSENTIFYIKCSTECYRNSELGIPNENVLPFSSGPGMNILVKYTSVQNQEKEWGPFFTDHFLFHTFSQDYKKIGDRSFGYFIAKEKLEETLKKHKISKDIVVALEYDEKSYTFKDISESFRKTLK